MFSGCVPPPCAISGRPPPLPPTIGAIFLIMSPALILSVWSFGTVAMIDTLPSTLLARIITVSCNLDLKSSIVERIALAFGTSTSVANTFNPLIVSTCSSILPILSDVISLSLCSNCLINDFSSS